MKITKVKHTGSRFILFDSDQMLDFNSDIKVEMRAGTFKRGVR